MFEKEIQTAKQQLSAHLLTGDTYVYLQDILNNPDVHSFYKGFFRGEVDWWIYEQKMLREANPRFDFGNKEFLGIQQEYDQYCRQTARFDHVELTSMIDLAAKTRVNYLLRPRTTLKWFVYRGEPTKPLHEVLLRFAYFDCYNYLLEEFGKWATSKVSDSSHQDILSVIEFERLIENIDNDIILEHTTSEFAELLSPLYEFFYEVQPEGQQHAIPTPALIIFLDDKGILRISQELERLMKEEDFDVITRQEFLNVIDKVILQVEDEAGVPQTFVDDSTIPLDFDHSTRRPVTPTQGAAEQVEPPAIPTTEKEVLTAAEQVQEMEPLPPVVEINEQIDGVETLVDESQQMSTDSSDADDLTDDTETAEPEVQPEVEEQTSTGEPEAEKTDIPDSEEQQPEVEEQSSAGETETEKKTEVVEIPLDTTDQPTETISDEAEVLESVSASESEESVPSVEEQEMSVPETESGQEVSEEDAFTIADVASEEDTLPGHTEIEESEELSLPDVESDTSIDESREAPESIQVEKSEEIESSNSTSHDEPLPDTDVSHKEPEPEYGEDLSAIPAEISEETATESSQPEAEQPFAAADTIEDETPAEHAEVTDFSDENPEEYVLSEDATDEQDTVFYTPEKERIGIWKSFEEELKDRERSEEELFNALFPSKTGKNVQSDAVPSVDAGQYEPDDMDEEEVLLEQTDQNTPGTPVSNGIHYSAIEELLDNNLKQRIVKHIFHKNEERFHSVLQRLNATQSWREASSIIDRVFSEYEVDPYSSIARKFSDIVYERFLTGQ